MQAEKYIIKNEFINSSDNVTEIRNPYSDEIVYRVYKSTSEDVNSSLNYLTGVFREYKNLPVYKKAELLNKIADKISSKKELLAQVMTKETGKPIKLSRAEVDRTIYTFRCGAEEARRIDGEIISIDQLPGAENKMGLIKRFPIGVILAITPWNFPMNLVAHKISPALASGNTVLLKPASASLVSGLEIVKIIKEVSDEMNIVYCPVNVVTCSG
ncbi:MAG TPA: aldehyde dehydrogenase family protein, partial [Ignavibacteria bacterium]|nr:aldehyde dehydrogenase family protein [Ignavibacteria bacterium]